MNSIRSLIFIILFLLISCRTKISNPKTDFFEYLKGRSISGPTEFWHMQIKGKNLYFFSDVHESEKGQCPNCDTDPMCDTIAGTLDGYFKQEQSKTHFVIESEFHSKHTDPQEHVRLRPAFLSKTIDHFGACLHETGKKNEENLRYKANCMDQFPETFFHYADIRDSLPILGTISRLRDVKSRIKKTEKELAEAMDLNRRQELQRLIFQWGQVVYALNIDARRQFPTKEKLLEFYDIFVDPSLNFRQSLQDKLRTFTRGENGPALMRSSDAFHYLQKYGGQAHKISKAMKYRDTGKRFEHSEVIQEALRAYYKEQMEKTFQIFLPRYSKNNEKLGLLAATRPGTFEEHYNAIFNEDTGAFSTLVFHLNYVLSNLYALGRTLRFLEDPQDDKDFVFYWGGAHIHHFLEFLSRHYGVSIKTTHFTRKGFRCVKVH